MPATVHALIEERADRDPDRPALTTSGKRFTAAELEADANRIAWALVERGVRSGDRVAVLLPRSRWLVPALLGVLKAGAAYVPIDRAIPFERLRFVLEDSGAAAVIGPAPHGLDIEALDPARCDGDPGAPPRKRVAGSDLAYVIYTSGSTGTPKGVMIEHRSVVNLIAGWPHAVPIGRGSVMAAVASVGFDIFVAETFVPLAHGLRVALASEDDLAAPSALAGFLTRCRVDVLEVTPSRLRWLLTAPDAQRCLKSVRIVQVGGEAVTPDVVWALRHASGAHIFNVYGPTEATVWTSAKALGPDEEITIGAPIPHVRYELLEPGRDALSRTETGELAIAGRALGRGYVNREELTRASFVEMGGERLFRTGDRAMRAANGDISVIGRLDDQVKIDGYRVELGEVEAVLAACPGVRGAAVVDLDAGGGRALVAALAPAGVAIEGVRQAAARQLPSYMLPARFVALHEIPLNSNGKVDRPLVRRLAESDGENGSRDPGTYIGDFVRGAVGVIPEPRSTSPLEAGLDSLGAVRLLAELEARFGASVSLDELLDLPSFDALASLVEDRAGTRTRHVRRSAECGKDWPLSPQQRCYVATFMASGNSSACTLQRSFKVGHEVTLWGLQRAVDDLVVRHPALRAYYSCAVPELRESYVARGTTVTDAVDAIDLDDEGPDTCLARLAAAELAINRWPLFRLTLLRGEPGSAQVVVLRCHHLISDGRSLEILEHELRQQLQGGAPLAPAAEPAGYRAFAADQRRRRLSPAFQEVRRGCLAAAALVAEETLIGRSTSATGGPLASYVHRADRAMPRRLLATARRLRCVPATPYLAAYARLLAEHLGRPHVAISVPLAERHQPGAWDEVGLFAGLGYVGAHADADVPSERLIAELHGQLVALTGGAGYLFHDLMSDLGVSPRPGRLPLTSVMFNQEDLPDDIEDALGLHIDLGRTVPFDLQLLLRTSRRAHALELLYRTDVLEPPAVERLAQRYNNLLEQFIETA